MPKELKLEKLNRKFSSLTRSKDSIQSLSSWIIAHKNFQNEIAEQWLTAVEKADDASHRLTLFYVANDVLQNCKRKGVVEFRTSFAEVLQDALAYARDIKDEILRMITIWGERNVLTPGILQLLQEQVDKEASSSSQSSTGPSSLKLQLTEENADGKFELQNLVTCLEILKQSSDDVTENFDNNKAVLSKAEISQLNLLDIRISTDVREMNKKLEQTIKGLEECNVSLAEEVNQNKLMLRIMEAGKAFYTKQNEDVRRVAHAYKIFAKKLYTVKKSLGAKKIVLQSPTNILQSPLETITHSSDSSLLGKITPQREQISLGQKEYTPKEEASYSSNLTIESITSAETNVSSSVLIKKKVNIFLKSIESSETDSITENELKVAQQKNKETETTRKVVKKDTDLNDPPMRKRSDSFLKLLQNEKNIKVITLKKGTTKKQNDTKNEVNYNDSGIETSEETLKTNEAKTLKNKIEKQNESLLLDIEILDEQTPKNEIEKQNKSSLFDTETFDELKIKCDENTLVKDVIVVDLISPEISKMERMSPFENVMSKSEDVKTSGVLPVKWKSEKIPLLEVELTPEPIKEMKNESEEYEDIMLSKTEKLPEIEKEITNEQLLKLSQEITKNEQNKVILKNDVENNDNSYDDEVSTLSEVEKETVIKSEQIDDLCKIEDSPKEIDNEPHIHKISDSLLVDDKNLPTKMLSTEQYLSKNMRKMMQLLATRKNRAPFCSDKCMFPIRTIFQILSQSLNATKHSLPLNDEQEFPKKRKLSNSTLNFPGTDIDNAKPVSKMENYNLDTNLGPMDMELDSDNDSS